MLASEIQEIINRIISVSHKQNPAMKLETKKESRCYWCGFAEGIKTALNEISAFASDNKEQIENDLYHRNRNITSETYERSKKQMKNEVDNFMKR